MSRRPISGRIRTGGGEEDDAGAPVGPPADELREAFSRWATGVTVVAVREEREVYAITATAFMPVSLDPPLVAVAIGPNATVLPFLAGGARFGISILAADQRRLASLFADPGPLGRGQFPAEGDPVLPGAVAAFACTVTDRFPGGDHRIVLGRIERVWIGEAGEPLIYAGREYRTLGPPRGRGGAG